MEFATTRGRSGPLIVGGTSVCLALALVTAGLLTATTSTDAETGTTTLGLASLTAAPTTEPGMSHLVSNAGIAATLASIRPSTVALSVDRQVGTVITTGLVAESGGIIVTASQAISGARSITVVEPSGARQIADLVSVDRTTGLAVLRIGDDLPAAAFGNDDPVPGAVALAVAMEPSGRVGGPPSPRVYGGIVISSGVPLAGGASSATFAATAVSTPLTDEDLGCPLLDGSGGVAGILEQVRTSGTSTTSVFLPGELVLGVVRQLVSSGTVDHGWSGLGGSEVGSSATVSTLAATAPSPSQDGAQLGAIDGDSPAAAAGLMQGDVVIGIDGHRVHSMAELRTRLYSDPPGTALQVTFERAGSTLTTSLQLGNVDADAQVGGSSP